MSAVAFTFHVALYCVAVAFVVVGLLQQYSQLWMSGFIIGLFALLFTRCTCTGLVCHLFDPELPIVMELDHPTVVPPELDNDVLPIEMNEV